MRYESPSIRVDLTTIASPTVEESNPPRLVQGNTNSPISNGLDLNCDENVNGNNQITSNDIKDDLSRCTTGSVSTTTTTGTKKSSRHNILDKESNIYHELMMMMYSNDKNTGSDNPTTTSNNNNNNNVQSE